MHQTAATNSFLAGLCKHHRHISDTLSFETCILVTDLARRLCSRWSLLNVASRQGKERNTPREEAKASVEQEITRKCFLHLARVFWHPCLHSSCGVLCGYPTQGGCATTSNQRYRRGAPCLNQGAQAGY